MPRLLTQDLWRPLGLVGSRILSAEAVSRGRAPPPEARVRCPCAPYGSTTPPTLVLRRVSLVLGLFLVERSVQVNRGGLSLATVVLAPPWLRDKQAQAHVRGAAPTDAQGDRQS